MIGILRLLPTALASLVLLTACAGQNAAIGIANLAASRNDTINKQTFHFTGVVQTFQVPSGVDKVTITAEGAGTPSALGGFVKATISVNPGDSLSIVVGGEPEGKQGGYNGGADGGPCDGSDGCGLSGHGGAGASDVRLGGSALRDRILVAGGAGGQGGRGEFRGGAGGEGGGLSGGRADNGITVGSRHGGFGRAHGGGGAGGGTQRRGGTRGAGGNGYIPGNAGSPGMLAIGGAGADNYCAVCSVKYGLLAGGSGGGGGGGYYGGGGGGSGGNNDSYIGYGRTGIGSGGGGGGGSSFVEPGAQNVSIESGKGSGTNGLIVISW
jgi:hypothetical protein